MFYKPNLVNEMWDTWLYYHEGVHYLFYLHKTNDDVWDGMSVATSTDGVHYREVGPIVSKRGDAEWLGTGSVWHAGDRFILNFSESRNGVQAVFFAESNDLLHWERLGDQLRCDPDPRWYDNTKAGRWDCIWCIPKPDDAGFWGYLTARPWSKTPGIRYDSIGMVESEDGIHWHSVAPPVFDWGDWPQMSLGEVGAIEEIDGRYYLMLGYSEYSLGNRYAPGEFRYRGGIGGMYCFSSDSPQGPFTPNADAYRLLVSDGTYFTRFYRSPDGMLVNHHSMESPHLAKVWMAPLKRAIVGADRQLRLGYWKGNDVVKGSLHEIDLSASEKRFPTDTKDWISSPRRLEADGSASGGIGLLNETFNPEKGVVLEGSLTVHAEERPWAGIGLFIEQAEPDTESGDNRRDLLRGTAIVMETRGRTEIGHCRNAAGGSFRPIVSLDIGIGAGTRHLFRLLLRRQMLELYLNDILVACHTLDALPSGRLGLVLEGGKAVYEDLRAWEMNL